MIRQPPSSTRTYILFPYSTLFRSKPALFSAAQPGADATANSWINRPVYLSLPETVGKDYRSAYVETVFHHSNATSITVGTVTTTIYGEDRKSTRLNSSH